MIHSITHTCKSGDSKNSFWHPRRQQDICMSTHDRTLRHHRQLKLIDLENVNRSLFPEFKEDVLYKTVLKPGDLLSMPPYWFHQVRSLTSSIALNIWSLSSVASILQDAVSGPVGEIFKKSCHYHPNR